MRTTLRDAATLVVGACLAAAPVWAQHDSHTIIMPNDIKWADVPSLPPGAKIAVLEGKMNEAGPITARLKFPANYKVPAHFHPAWSGYRAVRTMNFGMGTSWIRRKQRPLVREDCSSCRPDAHFVWTKEKPSPRSTSSAVDVTYVNPGRPQKK